MSDVRALIRPIAHRGLHAASRGIVENTASAFEAAIAKGYGIECDLQPATGFEPVVFHDYDLGRLTEGKGKVRELSARELARIPMRRTRDHIITLGQMLELVAGRVPLLIEIKSDWVREDDFTKSIAQALQSYRGAYGLMSFDPNKVRPFRQLLPDAPLGIVAGGIRRDRHMLPWIKRWTAKRLWMNDILRPDFLAYYVRGLPSAGPGLAKRPTSMPLFTWTVRTPTDRAKALRYADAMIFEGFEPPLDVHAGKK
jgi:glycerophosphoryl diester phosphodiesterase